MADAIEAVCYDRGILGRGLADSFVVDGRQLLTDPGHDPALGDVYRPDFHFEIPRNFRWFRTIDGSSPESVPCFVGNFLADLVCRPVKQMLSVLAFKVPFFVVGADKFVEKHMNF